MEGNGQPSGFRSECVWGHRGPRQRRRLARRGPAEAGAQGPGAEAGAQGSGALACLPKSMSFFAHRRGKLGAWSPLMILGPFKPYMGFAMAPNPKISTTASCSSPAAPASASPSARLAIMVPMSMFTTSFIRVPAPTSPSMYEACQRACATGVGVRVWVCR